jgi:hypothetical protein
MFGLRENPGLLFPGPAPINKPESLPMQKEIGIMKIIK